VFQGVDIFYYSIEQMVETCIDWVREPHYPDGRPDDAKSEMRIWRVHNPGIFEPR
jgi:hypothetical protein